MSEMWNSVAPAWERNAAFVDGHLAAATEVMLDAAHVGPGDAVLELATGPGGAGLAAARRTGETGDVVLADVAAEMVAIAARRAAGLPQVRTMACDQTAIGADEASFDAVIVRHGLMFADTPADAVREAVRVLRPGGRYAALTWDRRERNPWLGIVLDAVGEQFGVPFPPPGMAGPFALDDAAALRALLEDGGLLDVHVEALAAPMQAPSLEAWWGRVPELGGPLAQMLAALEPEVRDAIRDRAMANGRAAAREEAGGMSFDGSVLVASGRTPAPSGRTPA